MGLKRLVSFFRTEDLTPQNIERELTSIADQAMSVIDGRKELAAAQAVVVTQIIQGVAVDLEAYQEEVEKGVANGYAGLNSDGEVPVAQLPFDGLIRITVSATAPVAPQPGHLWIQIP